MQKDKSYLPLTKEQVASNIFGNVPSRSVSLYQPINKNIQNTIPLIQNIDTNLSNVENPLFPGKMLSTGALEEINRLNKPTSISSQVAQPEIQNEEEQNNNRFLASLLSQGVAMFGAGIAGRDPMRTAESIEDMRYYQRRSDERQKQIDQAKKLMDPKSQESQRKRNLYNKVLGLPIPEDVSASDLEDPVVLNSLKQQSIQAQMAKMTKQVGVAQPKVEKEKKNPFQKEITEISIRSKNAMDSLNKIEEIVQNYGTRELSGPQEKQLEQLIQNVAINYNKVLDPTSVVREGEAKQVAESLGLGGYGSYFTGKDTALKQVKSFKDLVTRTRNNALSGYSNLPTDTDFNEKDQFVINEYRKNPDDPKIKELYNDMLTSKGLR